MFAGVCPSTVTCEHGGYTNPQKCSKCLCPDGFGGDKCTLAGDSSNGCSPKQTSQIKNITTSPNCLKSPQYGSGNYPVNSQCNWYLQVRSYFRFEGYY